MPQIKGNQISNLDTDSFKDGSIDAVDIKDGTVTSAKVASVGEDKIAYTDKTRTVFFPWGDFAQVSAKPDIVTWSTSQQGYGFDAAADEYVTGSLDVPEDAKAASSVYLDAIWCPITAPSSENVVWSLDYTTAGEGEAFPATTNNQQTAGAGTVQYKHIATAFAAISSLDARDVISVRLGRLGTSGSDTYGSDAVFLGIRMRYTSDKRGT